MKKLFKLFTIACLTSIASTTYQINNFKTYNNVKYLASNADDKVKEVLDLIDLNIDKEKVVYDIKLPFTSLYGSTISWTSSNNKVIQIVEAKKTNGGIASITGKVIQDKNNDIDVELTAMVSYVEAGKTYTGNKTIKVKVLKQKTIEEENIPLNYEDDFSSYLSNIDLGNYYKWQTSGNLGLGLIKESVESNINNAPIKGKMLELTSKRLSSNITYKKNLNASKDNVRNIDSKQVVALEFETMFEGTTNGVEIQLLSNTRQTVKFILDDSSYKLNVKEGTSAVQTDLNLKAKEGIWQHFRIEVNILTGYLDLFYYDFTTDQYVSLTSSFSSYDALKGGVIGAGINNGIINGLAIVNKSGTSNGKTYISSIKFDDASILTKTKIQNPNREKGIGIIKNYDDIVCGFENEEILNQTPDFKVHNRFNEEETFTLNTDYTVSAPEISQQEDIDGYKKVTKTYTITLKQTNEQKIVKQDFYSDSKDNAPRIVNFKVSYLKQDATDLTKGRMTISGNIYRNEATIYFKVVEKDSNAPSIEEMKQETGYTFDNGISKDSKEISIDTPLYDISKEYDVYVLATSDMKDSKLYKASSVSTVVNLSTPEDLYDMQTNPSTASSKFRLINDIDCTSYEWKFDANLAITFKGELDGQGYSIKGLTIFTGDEKVGLFSQINGATIKNLTFEEADITGSSDTAVLVGQMQNGTIENVNLLNCKVSYMAESSSEGYYAGLVGRFRTDGNVSNINNINIVGLDISANKYIGLLTGGVGGSSQDVTVNMKNIYVEGSVDTDGAGVGLIGRNRAKTTIDNAIVILDVLNAKKEVGAIAGHNKEGGSLVTNNIVTDLKISSITQPTYFNSYIGSHDANTSTYKGENVYYVSENYDHISETINPTPTAISYGTSLANAELDNKVWWEKNTFLRDFDVSLSWYFNEEEKHPEVKIRDEASISFTKEDYKKYIDELEKVKVVEYRYYLYKGQNVYKYLSDEVKNDAEVINLKTKFDKYMKDYEEYIQYLEDLNTDIDNIAKGGK